MLSPAGTQVLSLFLYSATPDAMNWPTVSHPLMPPLFRLDPSKSHLLISEVLWVTQRAQPGRTSNAHICTKDHSLSDRSLQNQSLVCFKLCYSLCLKAHIKVTVSSCWWLPHLFLNLHIIIIILTTKNIKKSQVRLWRQISWIKAFSIIIKIPNALKLNNSILIKHHSE